jgi:hypothetical protein
MFKLSTSLFAVSVLCLASLASANPPMAAGSASKAAANALSEEVNKNCAADAKKTVSCDGKKVGAGLISCLDAMIGGKMAFKLSPECKKSFEAWKKANPNG